MFALIQHAVENEQKIHANVAIFLWYRGTQLSSPWMVII